MRELRAGERIDIAGGRHELRIAARGDAILSQRIGAVVVPLGADGKLVADFAPVVGSSRELRPGIAFVAGHGIELDVDALPPGVDRLTLILYVIGGAASGVSMADLGDLTLDVDDALRFRIDLTGRRESALIAVEAYRRGAGWRLSANGQGFIGGIAAIGNALGIGLVVPDAASAGPERGNERPAPGSSSGGSGFAVTPQLIVTNFHVIEHGSRMTAAGESRTGPAELVATDEVNDIALLRLTDDARGIARFRADHDIDLGEDVIVGGFPLQGLLGTGPQISGGNISALTGMRNDSSQLQFNAPIGSGSSGGPIIDTSGLIVGLVRAVLRTDIDHAPVAQNINFGVKGALVRCFLHAAGVTPAMSPSTAPRSRADIAREARTYLYRLHVDY